MQAAINAASNFLPTDLPNPPIYSKVNPADAPILTLALTSTTVAADRSARTWPTRAWRRRFRSSPASGWSASAAVSGPPCACRRTPGAGGLRALSLDDVRTAIASANVNQAKGNFDGPAQASTIDANDQLRAAEYKPIIIAYHNGAPVRLSDVADRDRGPRTPGSPRG